MKTGHLTSIIFSKLSNVYFVIRVPSLPKNYLTKFLTEAKGLMRTKHLGFGVCMSFFFFSNYKATPVPIDLPIIIIFLS
jgi:hypothetical protein